MNGYRFSFHGASLEARAPGALWWPAESLLCVSDLHLGRSERYARRNRGLLPPYEGRDTLARLEAEIAATEARRVVCLGDSFDDLAAADALDEPLRLWLTRLMAGRDWVWIEGNHDPGPVDLGGAHLAALSVGALNFRHVAIEEASAEISGHYHPKAQLDARGGALSRPCFLIDSRRVILPAFGTYTGGLRCSDPALTALMSRDAIAVLTGARAIAMPMPRGERRRAARPA